MSTATYIRALDAAMLSHLQSWIGKTETLSDDITAAPLRGLSATLDRADAAPVHGVTVLPPLWHWLYFLPQQRQREIIPDDVLLFRYSALTFNGHRIHYDRKYVTEVEGYPGLMVHGPLIATLLLDLLRRHLPDAFVKRFNFKAVRPTFDLHPFRINGEPSADGKNVRLWAEDHEGWLTMQGSAELA